MEVEVPSTVNTAAAPRRSRRLWIWFVGGFVLVFIGMLVLVHMTAMHRSGQYAVRSPLWRYYAESIPRLFGPSTMGPASGDSSSFVETILLHLLFSVAGGGAAAAVGRWVDKRRHRVAAG